MSYRPSMNIGVLGVLILALVLSACAARQALPTLVPQPTSTAVPTNTAQPAATSAPTPATQPTPAASPTALGAATVVPTRLAGADLPQPIVFIDLRQQLARLAPDGTLTEVTSEPGNMLDFDLSPDASALVYLSAQSGTMLLVQSDALGGSRTELASGFLRAPLFDPAGERILFAVDVAGAKAGQTTLSTGVWSIPTGGGVPTQLIEGIAAQYGAEQTTPGLLYAPLAWSPDHTLLLVLTAPDFGPDLPAGDIGSVGLSVFNPTDNAVRELIPPGGDPRLCINPSWAADSAAVLCATPYAVGSETPALFRIDLATGNLEDLLLREGPDGAQIAVLGAFSGPSQTTALLSYRQGDSAQAMFERFGSDPERRSVVVSLDIRPDVGSAVVWAADGGGAIFSVGGERPQLVWQPFDGGPPRILVEGYTGRVRWGT